MQRFVVQSAHSRDSGGKTFFWKIFSESFCNLLSCLVMVGDMSVFSRVAFVFPVFLK
jgi:hypothetical protein